MDLLEAVTRARRRDQEALHFLFTAFYPEAYRAAYLLTRNAGLAEEATQEAFIKAFERLGSLKEPQKFAAWLRAIAGRCAIDVLRRERNYFPHADPATLAPPEPHANSPPFPAPEDAGEGAERRATVRQAVAALEPPYRLVIILRYYHDLDLKEIAAALGCPVGTVKSRLHRALRFLEKHLLAGQEDGELMVGASREEEKPSGK